MDKVEKIQDEEVIQEVSRIVNLKAGVSLGENRHSMVRSRMTRRILELGFKDFATYFDYLRANLEAESETLVSLLTTHHTAFFREFFHFEYLEKQGLPQAIEAMRQEGRTTLKVWSSACSTGQEVYSLAIFIKHHLKRLAPEMNVKIVGTDVDPKSIRFAQNAVYPWKDVKASPAVYLNGNWVRGTGDISQFVKLKSPIRELCHFSVLNLLDITPSLPDEKFDFIFCRNVLIYFTQAKSRKIVSSLLPHLFPHGKLILGVSETARGMELPIHLIGPSLYSLTPALVEKTQAKETLPKTLKVFCVDDSPTILALLKSVLKPERGFEVVGTAKNGIEAAAAVENTSFDLMTLDLHMPEEDGLTYLRTRFSEKHPPVVVLSSASRDDVSTGIKALEWGASDFIEKPSSQDLSNQAEELFTKLRCAYSSQKARRAPSSVEKAFSTQLKIEQPDNKLRLLFGNLGDFHKIEDVLRELKGSQPPTIVFLPWETTALEGVASTLIQALGMEVETLKQIDNIQKNKIYLSPLSQLDQVRECHAEKPTSLLVFGDITSQVFFKIAQWPLAQLIIEDLGFPLSSYHTKLKEKASRFVTHKSFAYHSNEFFSADPESPKPLPRNSEGIS